MSKILIVTSTSFMRGVIKDMLSKHGYTDSCEAANGIQAIEQYKTAKPDLVLMDITMPEMDGITALKEIKKLDSSAKVVMCSGLGEQPLVIESIQNGAKDFVTKPIQENRIIEAVKKTLGH